MTKQFNGVAVQLYMGSWQLFIMDDFGYPVFLNEQGCYVWNKAIFGSEN
jgi:hypothetical protein